MLKSALKAYYFLTIFTSAFYEVFISELREVSEIQCIFHVKKFSKNKKNTVCFSRIQGVQKFFSKSTGCPKTRLTTMKKLSLQDVQKSCWTPCSFCFFLKKNLSTEWQVRIDIVRNFGPDCRDSPLGSCSMLIYHSICTSLRITFVHLRFQQLFATNKSTSASFQRLLLLP